ncbi:hypothetical protein MMC13_008318 [Lambiella insularis]|nr:hypothetical protein [Lambiella insularis]
MDIPATPSIHLHFTKSITRMCFGKKPTAPPRAMYISAPMSVPFDYEKNPIHPWQNPYSTHAPRPVPPPIQKRAFTKSTYHPKPVPIFDSDWRNQQTHFERQWHEKEEPKPKSPLSPSIKWLRLSPTTRLKLWKNAGVDESGRLKLDFEELADPDWGEPEGYSPVSKKSIW